MSTTQKVCVKRHQDWNYLTIHPCVDCGESDPTVLEFDHVRGKKFAAISSMIGRGFQLERIKQEIEKCEVRCSHCHQRKTARDHGWFRWGRWALGVCNARARMAACVLAGASCFQTRLH